MTNLPPISRVNCTQKSGTNLCLGIPQNKAEDFGSIVVMSGSAKRRRLENKEIQTVQMNEKNNFKGSIMQLRAPFCKPHHKHTPTEEKLITKSCEILFECIKPYKDIRVTRKTQVKKSTRATARILTTDIIYERKATRKIQYYDLPESQNVFSHQFRAPPVCLTELDSDKIKELETKNETELEKNSSGKAVSSEDFITNAFFQPESALI